ncbi:MAG TPA: hypothetical protein VFB22_14600 [Candidatus Baltobacteraceae bacterium]|nr:hypothetical protein [Candidatus Baltobacteraceae bacterium]
MTSFSAFPRDVTSTIPREPHELWEPLVRPDTVRRVATARVVFANHGLVRRDFPRLTACDDAGVERWLLARAGVVSTSQTAADVANTPVDARGAVMPAWRPPRYGRATIVAANFDEATGAARGLIDVKGAGVAPGCTPARTHHASGLCTLGELLREVAYQMLVDRIFAHAAPDLRTLPFYGLLDLGFDVVTRTFERVPAGALARRAHRREIDGVEIPANDSDRARLLLEIELFLRRYGVTSANRGTRFRVERHAGRLTFSYANEALPDPDPPAYENFDRWLRDETLPLECDVVNVQLTRDEDANETCRAQLVDFGHFVTQPRFDNPLAVAVHDMPLCWGTTVRTTDERFVQPDRRLCVPPSLWGGTRPDVPRSRSDRSTGWASALAHDVRAGRIDGAAAHAAIVCRVDATAAGWPQR